MKTNSFPLVINSEIPESVNPDAVRKKFEDDPEAILALIDLIFFYVDEKPQIYS